MRLLDSITDSTDLSLSKLQASLSFTISQSLLKLRSVESVMLSNRPEFEQTLGDSEG